MAQLGYKLQDADLGLSVGSGAALSGTAAYGTSVVDLQDMQL